MKSVLDKYPTVHGRPGSYASQLMWRRGGAAAVLYLVAAPIIWLLWNAGSPVAYILAPVVVLVGREIWGKAKVAAVGARSERLVLSKLRSSPYIKNIWCGLRPGDVGGDIDMVVETRSGHFYVVEIKTGRGHLRYNPKTGRLSAGSRVIPGDPLAQVESASRRAAKYFKRNVWRVVCVPEAFGDPFTVEGTYVCNRQQLHDMLSLR